MVSSPGRERRLASGLGFGGVSGYRSVPAGRVTLVLTEPGSHVPVARTVAAVKAGARYTVVALATKPRVALKTYRDASPAGRISKVRLIDATPELGAHDLRIERRVVVKRIRFGESTSYLSLQPGLYDVAAYRPGGRGDPLIARRHVALPAGTSMTLLSMGTQGKPTRIVLAPDAAVVPAGAPATGLGGLAGSRGRARAGEAARVAAGARRVRAGTAGVPRGRPGTAGIREARRTPIGARATRLAVGVRAEHPDWPVVLVAALVAGSLGGTVYYVAGGAARRRRRRQDG